MEDIEDLSNKIFGIIDKEIEEAISKDISKDNCEKELWKIYNTFWKELKKVKGTSTGFSGLSEYIFFKALIKLLKKKGIEIEEKGKPYTYKPHTNNSKKEPETYYFSTKGEGVIVTCDLLINTTPPYLKNQEGYRKAQERKPDIVVFKDKKPVAIFEIKIYATNFDSLEKDINKMKQFEDAHKFVILDAPPKNYKKIEINDIKFIVKGEPNGYEGIERNIISFNDAVRIIAKELEK